jgi:hypothetical protein
VHCLSLSLFLMLLKLSSLPSLFSSSWLGYSTWLYLPHSLALIASTTILPPLPPQIQVRGLDSLVCRFAIFPLRTYLCFLVLTIYMLLLRSTLVVTSWKLKRPGRVLSFLPTSLQLVYLYRGGSRYFGILNKERDFTYYDYPVFTRAWRLDLSEKKNGWHT